MCSAVHHAIVAFAALATLAVALPAPESAPDANPEPLPPWIENWFKPKTTSTSTSMPTPTQTPTPTTTPTPTPTPTSIDDNPVPVLTENICQFDCILSWPPEYTWTTYFYGPTSSPSVSYIPASTDWDYVSSYRHSLYIAQASAASSYSSAIGVYWSKYHSSWLAAQSSTPSSTPPLPTQTASTATETRGRPGKGPRAEPTNGVSPRDSNTKAGRHCRRQEMSSSATPLVSTASIPAASSSATPTTAPASDTASSSASTSDTGSASSAASSSAVPVSVHKKRRIAVVGAGASGSGAAFFLVRAARVVETQLGLPAGSLLEIVVYEKNDYIGGRATTTTFTRPFGGQIIEVPLELGATIFVPVQQNLMKIARMFGLRSTSAGSLAVKMNIWDGKNVVYTQTAITWLDTLNSFFRYGLFAAQREAAAISTFVNRMAKNNDPSFLAQRGVVNSIEEYGASLQLGNEYTSKNGLDWATNVAGMSSRWANEMVDTGSRVNWGNDVTQVHGLAAVGGRATEGATIIPGGNWQMFAGILNDSGADVRLNTPVTNIASVSVGTGYTVSSSNSPGNDTYDEVFWGNPWHASPVAKTLEFTTPIPPQEYVHMHTTWVATTAPRPRSQYFKEPKSANMSGSILTTGERFRRTGNHAPTFQTLLYQYFLPTGEYLVLIHSKAEVSDAALADIFGPGTVTWTHRKVWDTGSYPVLKPTTSFPPVQPRKGFHYLAAMEPYLSTMEMQVISAREAVARAVQDWWGLGLGECVNDSSWDLSCEPHAEAMYS